MIKKKVLALILAAATALTMFPAALADEEPAAQSETAQKKEVLLYSTDFETGTVTFDTSNNYSHTGTVGSDVYSLEEEENNTYGAFNVAATEGVWGRYALTFSSDGITEGKLHVEFRFRPNEGTAKGFGSVLVGNCDQIGGRTATPTNASGNWFTLIDVNNEGSLKTLNVDGKGTALKDSEDNDVTVTEDTWYTCRAVIDLDNRGVEIEVTEGDTDNVFTASATDLPIRTGEWGNWPAIARIETAKFKDIAVLSAMDIDDIKISCDPIEATDFKLIRGDGGNKGQLTFNHNAAEVGEGAVKIEDVSLNGTPSDNGKTYIVDLPETLTEDTEYTVTVDQSKIKMKTVQESEGADDNPYGVGTKTFTFTIKPELLLYSEDFEGENPKIYVFTDTAGGYETDEKYNMPERFKVAEYTDPTDNNTKYGSFYSGSWEQVQNDPNNYYKRVGYQFSNEGITKGKMRVKFKFRSNDGPMSYGVFLLGNNTTRWNWLACVGFDKIKANGADNPVKIVDDASIRFLDKYQNGTWYSYEATIDLDDESIDASLYDMDGKLVKNLKWAANGVLRPLSTGAPFQKWPNNWADADRELGSPYSVKSFAAYTNLDLDDIEIYAEEIINIEATAIDFINTAGNTSSEADTYTQKAKITFDTAVDSVGADAVKLGDTVCQGGELSDNGKTYTVTLPEKLKAGEEYTLTLDYTQVTKTRASGAAVTGTGSKEFKFTPVNDMAAYSLDFETDGVQFYEMGNSGVGAAVTEENKYSQETEANGNKYGRFSEVDWGRRGVRFNNSGISSGKIDLHFDFRPNSKTFESGAFGAALIGNCDRKYNLLSALRIDEDGRISAGNLSTNYPFLKQSGEYANVKNESLDGWYAYDAVIDLDTRSADMKITNKTSGEIYKLTLPNMMARDGVTIDKSTNEWGGWPKETLFKDFAALGAIDLDNISIKTHGESEETIGAENDLLKLTVEAGKVTAQLKEPKEGVLFLAQYSADNALIKLDTENIQPESEQLAIEENIADGAEKFKTFIWNTLEQMEPLAPAVAYPAEKPLEYNILVIGNSFADDSIYYLFPVAAADGVVINATNCYYGGRPLATHANRMRPERGDYKEDYDVKRPGNALIAKHSSFFALDLDDWDVVAVQGTTHMSGTKENPQNVVYDKSLWEDNDADWKTILDTVKEHAPNAKRLTHMTWAPHEIRAELFAETHWEALTNLDQDDDLRTGYLKSVIPHYAFGAEIYSSNAGEMIPTGIAVEYVLTHFDGYFKEHEEESGDDSNGGHLYQYFEGSHALYRDDTCHLSHTGRILASLVWYETITGNSALDNKFVGYGLTEEDMQKLREAAHYACQNYKHYLD